MGEAGREDAGDCERELDRDMMLAGGCRGGAGGGGGQSGWAGDGGMRGRGSGGGDDLPTRLPKINRDYQGAMVGLGSDT